MAGKLSAFEEEFNIKGDVNFVRAKYHFIPYVIYTSLLCHT